MEFGSFSFSPFSGSKKSPTESLHGLSEIVSSKEKLIAEFISSSSLPEIQIYQYQPSWRLPSADPHCIQLQAFLKFTGIPFEVNNCNNPKMSPSETLPMLRIGENLLLTDMHEIASVLEKKGFSLDSHFSSAEKAHAEAFSSMVRGRLYCTMMWNWWAEEQNYKEVTFPQWSNYLPFPLNYILIPLSIRKDIFSVLRTLNYGNSSQVYQEASEIYEALSVFLDNKPYFFGERPSSLDAMVFGHLSCQLFAPMKVNSLASLISKHQNLLDYVNHIMGEFFGSTEPYVVKISCMEITSTQSLFKREDYYRQMVRNATILGGGGVLLFYSVFTLKYILSSRRISDFFSIHSREQ